MFNTYPPTSDQKELPAIKIYGNRIHADQSLYEYLIEFLLVFSSAKDVDGNGKLAFHPETPNAYFVEPRNGLRRFIFFEKAKRTKVEYDEKAYIEIKKILSANIEGSNEEKDKFIMGLQELFRGYAAVLKKRTWCAQELLPMCPEMIFCEQMPNDKSRFNGPPSGYENGIAYGCDPDATFYDSSFDLNRHNFLARGGETYYLHLLQVIENDKSRRTKLEKYLKNLLTDKSKQFSDLANWIQGKWESAKKLDHSKLIHRIPIGYIPVGAYTVSGNHAVDELITFLSNEMHPVKRVELLAKGVMYQILRMQLEQTAKYLNDKPYPLVLDMKSRKGGTIIRQLSVNSFNRVTDAFTSAINKCIVADRDGSKEPDLPAEYATYIKSKKESLDVFRSKGKELQCIIPSNGPFERFSLSEDVARFLVLSLVKPGARMDLDSFLKAMYEHFNIVIGPNEFVADYGADSMDRDLVNSFIYNREAFQTFLQSAGFLRDLSDATSIVVNPYKEVELK